MSNTAHKAVAIVGVGAVMPEARDASEFWTNVKKGRYSIGEVPSDRWEIELYYDPDPKAPDKSYSKIGGFVRDFDWNPLRWKLPIPPKVSDAMDRPQKWAICCTREALADYGKPLDNERTAVILGHAMAGDRHYLTAARILFPEFGDELRRAPSFGALPAQVQAALMEEFHGGVRRRFPSITEDTMPGELANIVAGRVAAVFNFHGPNFVVDAACASAMAAINAAIEGLEEHDYDAVLTGGIDANMGPSSYIKFCKIGALSASGTRPYAEGADGFVMGEGGAVLLLKRLEDAERDGDKIYAVIRGVGGSSDGKGKGITAPNPVGQRYAVQRAWDNAGVSPATATLIEGHGTSTRVGDAVELEVLDEIFGEFGLPAGSVALGSVKSNIGHLKGAAGAAGVFKAALSLHERVLPPSLNFQAPNRKIDFSRSSFRVNTELRPWEHAVDGVRRAGVSAFGFGGTNFHVVLEEHIPGRLTGERRSTISVPTSVPSATPVELKAPLRGALVIGDSDPAAVARRLRVVLQQAEAGRTPPNEAPREADLRAATRLAIDFGDAAELLTKGQKALKALQSGNAGLWRALQAQGVFFGTGPAPKVAFLYPGQGSQYVNMLGQLRTLEPIIADTFAEADRVMRPLLGGKALSDYVFVDTTDSARAKAADNDLRQTAITQPAVLTADAALTRLMGAYGIAPDLVMGHSLGEYGALEAAGALPLPDALEAVSARGREMTNVSVADPGAMVAVFGPLEEVQRTLEQIEGYVVIANINSHKQAVVGGATEAVQGAARAFSEQGYQVVPLPVSHAFHTEIVAAASEPLRRTLERLDVRPPEIPVAANINGEFYPMGPGVSGEITEILARQVAAPVQFVKGLHTLYQGGARVFVEMGPKKALCGFVEDVLGDKPDVVALFSNHPKLGDVPSFNQALCGLYAAGLGVGRAEQREVEPPAVAAQRLRPPQPGAATVEAAATVAASSPAVPARDAGAPPAAMAAGDGRFDQMGRFFADFLQRSYELFATQPAAAARPTEIPVTITGAGLGLPGCPRVFDDGNLERILRGETFLAPVSQTLRRTMLDKNITRLVKSDRGEARFETISDAAEVIKLAGRAGEFDLAREYGVPEERVAVLDTTTRLAMGAGIDALRDAGIPLVMHYKTTTKGTKLPDRWMLPEQLRDDTGVIFGSAFPGYDELTADLKRHAHSVSLLNRIEELERVEAELEPGSAAVAKIEQRIAELRAEYDRDPYRLDRRWLFKVLSMGHSQFAEYIGARGPNTQVNAACASGSQALAIACDWVRQGRCRRVICISADDVTSDNLWEWIGAGFLASGAAATDEAVKDAALPFDRRRHGLLLGMGGAAVIVERLDAAQERGVQPICEVLGAVIANSAFHGSRLDVGHITMKMEELIAGVEQQWGLDRRTIAPQLVFVSHETYTPARGGSAQSEVEALRTVFGSATDQIVIANTKGYTGHAMGTGIEEVLAAKMLETGVVPPVANFREVDPELGPLNLSRGGSHPVNYALRLAAGFGSQLALSLVRWIPSADGRRRQPRELGFAYRICDATAWDDWMRRISGYAAPALEVVNRTLRVQDQGPAERAARAAVERPQQRASAPAVLPVASAGAGALPRSARGATSAARTTAQSAGGAGEAAGEAAQAGKTDPVRQQVLAIVAETTGYPSDMLDLELDLEADLGIDTVKQAETFAAVREAYQIPREDQLQLRDFPTLGHVIQFVYDRRPDLAAQRAAAPAEKEAATAAAAAADPVRDAVLEIVCQQTGYPSDMLDLELDLEADLGIDTVKQAETFAAVREAYQIPREESLQLRDFPTLGHVIQFVYDRRPDLAAQRAATPVSAASTVATVDRSEQKPGEPPSDDTAAVGDPVQAAVLQIVQEQTGYPSDMLDLELDLEADLGIDTVKQAETFAAVREQFAIAREEELQLRDFPTLGHVIQFVYDRRPDLKAQAGATQKAVETSQQAEPAEPAADPVAARVLAVISEQTGYPVEMLDLEADLEADLGIDTVKQAETFAAVREAYGIARDEQLQLRDFPTIKHVVGWVYLHRPDLRVAALATAEPTGAKGGPREPASEGEADQPQVASPIPRRLPDPVLRPPIELCKPTGVELTRGKRVLLMPDREGVGQALRVRLEQRGVTVLQLEGAPPASALTEQLQVWLAEGPIDGVYWLPALDAEGDLWQMQRDEWREALRLRVKLLFHTMRALQGQIAEKGSFLLAATRLGGRHGYDEGGALAPMGGAVCGFVKACKRERGDTLCKVVDFAAGRDPAQLADLLIAETLQDPGVVEVGHDERDRWTVGMREEPAGDRQLAALDQDSVVVVTGAAGSIVSAIVADLARCGGTFYLLDLAPAPDPADGELGRLAEDREGLKREIFERLRAEGQRATPVVVEKRLARLERQQAALAAIEAVQAAGGTAHYRQVDLTDADAVSGVIDELRGSCERVDLLLHAAGLEISHFLPDKQPDEFDLVFDVKADGWFHLLRALGDLPLACTVAFSSVAGRFGNAGQTDYSAANDLLCKIASHMRRSRPETRAIAIDWTAWREIGMAARGSIPKMMELAGIDMLPPAEGIPVVGREVTNGFAGELIVGQRLGILTDPWDETGGLDLSRLEDLPGGPMVARVTGLDLYQGLTVETTLNPAEQPFLYDHQIDGTPVLPGVMGIEGFGEIARLLFPRWHVVAVEGVEFLAPFKFYRNEPRTVTLHAQFYREQEELVARCWLSGSRRLPRQKEPQVTVHFTARVRLARQPVNGVKGDAPAAADGPTVSSSEIYEIYFHGPAYRVLERAWRRGELIAGMMPQQLPANHRPDELPTVLSPRLIELCFQTAGIHEIGTTGKMGLPLRVDEIRAVRNPEEAGHRRLFAVVEPDASSGGYNAQVIDEEGDVYLVLRGYRTVELPSAVPDDRRRPLASAMA